VQQLLQDVEGKSFPDIMQQLVLKPLGMKHSTFAQPLPASLLKNTPTGYLPDGSAVASNSFVYPEMAPAGLWTTAEDLAKFAIDVQLAKSGKSTKVLSRETVTTMLTPFAENHTGLGIGIDQKPADTYFQHGGWNQGFSSHLIAHQDKGYGVVILTNANQPIFVRELVQAVADTYNWSDFLIPVYKNLPITEADIKQITGRYRFQEHEKMSVFARDNRLFYQFGLEEAVELYKVAESTFIRREWATKIQFLPNPTDNQLHLVFNSGEKPVSFSHPKLRPEEKVPYEWLAEGQFEKALAAYQQLKKQSPDHFTAQEDYLAKLGNLWLKNNDIKQAIAIFKINTLLYPQSAGTFYQLAEAHQNNGDTELAKQNYLQVLSLDPQNSQAVDKLQKLNSK
jgi:tetratricopeptide (TPR) repeat protein